MTFIDRRKRRLPRDTHLVAGGRVFCVTLGDDRDVDTCLHCPRFRKQVEVAGQRAIRCRPMRTDRDSVAPDWRAAAAGMACGDWLGR